MKNRWKLTEKRYFLQQINVNEGIVNNAWKGRDIRLVDGFSHKGNKVSKCQMPKGKHNTTSVFLDNEKTASVFCATISVHEIVPKKRLEVNVVGIQLL